MRRFRVLPLLAALLLVSAACGDDDEGVEIAQPWARASANMQDAGAAYMQVTSATDDVLVAASVDSNVAAMVELHEVVMVEMSDDDSADEGMGGAMRMQQVEGGIELPAGETVALEPGGYHVMLMNLAEPFEAGDTFTVTLEFETAETIEVEVEVREEAP